MQQFFKQRLNRHRFEEALLVRDGLGQSIIHHLAQEEGDLKMLKYICQKALHTSNPNAADKDGNTPIHLF